jgi:hypothetical protein
MPIMGWVLASFEKISKFPELAGGDYNAVLELVYIGDFGQYAVTEVFVLLSIGFGNILGIAINGTKELLIGI